MKTTNITAQILIIILLSGVLITFFLVGCSGNLAADATTSAGPALPSTPTPIQSAKIQHTPTIIQTITPTSVPENTPTLEPPECRTPPDDYDLVNINGHLLNRRTLSMLEYAQTLYGGEIEITGYAITQGSFNDNGAASFGTHLGGGAVDLSVMRTHTYNVLYDEIPALLRALRLAGFAAWLREPDEVYHGSAIHIHAIAIGDRDLSDAAQAQLTGEAGYFRGYSGLPPVNGAPTQDRFGGPVICQWMLDAGYEDLRSTPVYDDMDLPKKCLCDP